VSQREDLIALIEGSRVELPEPLCDDTSLIRSGLLDSLALFNLVLWIETQIGAPVNPAALDLSREWDTPADILRYIERERRG
jgi:acyl carrier protein